MTLKDKFEMMRQLWLKCAAEEQNEQARRRQMHVCRTVEGTAFEGVCALIVVATLGTEIALAVREHDFNPLDMLTVLLLPALIAGLLYTAYHPQWLHVGDTKIENARQLTLLVRSARVVALCLALFLFGESVCHLVGIKLPEWTNWVLTGLLVAIGIYYDTRISNYKS